MNSPLDETALLQSGELSRKRGRERRRRTPAAVPRSVLSIVIPRSHAIPDKTSLRVINLPGKLTSLEGTSTRSKSLQPGIRLGACLSTDITDA